MIVRDLSRECAPLPVGNSRFRTTFAASASLLLSVCREHALLVLETANIGPSGAELREFGNSTIMKTQQPLAEGCVSG